MCQKCYKKFDNEKLWVLHIEQCNIPYNQNKCVKKFMNKYNIDKYSIDKNLENNNYYYIY